ncbi:MAG: CsbD family protein [Anaerolineae bacterium]|uniref:CsbD family protein n=1 Tax=Promineifilum sp. TaxID=2664178 RepID=UPI001E0C4519|nr:CsbD family protein [Anaerolineales bacterium]MCB8935417.1 CsbD family protein [Promineifilum sp.]MCO5181567.1 CsbD family protein [Promineifilum sp.]MCW5846476.1 CsbD family protein [Anaerolineae bacterium]
MNDDILQGKWAQMKGKIKQQWGKLTDDDLDRIGGKRDEIVGLMQERYGWERERAETEFDDYLKGQDW